MKITNKNPILIKTNKIIIDYMFKSTNQSLICTFNFLHKKTNVKSSIHCTPPSTPSKTKNINDDNIKLILEIWLLNYINIFLFIVDKYHDNKLRIATFVDIEEDKNIIRSCLFIQFFNKNSSYQIDSNNIVFIQIDIERNNQTYDIKSKFIHNDIISNIHLIINNDLITKLNLKELIIHNL